MRARGRARRFTRPPLPPLVVGRESCLWPAPSRVRVLVCRDTVPSSQECGASLHVCIRSSSRPHRNEQRVVASNRPGTRYVSPNVDARGCIHQDASECWHTLNADRSDTTCCAATCHVSTGGWGVQARRKRVSLRFRVSRRSNWRRSPASGSSSGRRASVVIDHCCQHMVVQVQTW